jgi:site-specific DNA recombinase
MNAAIYARKSTEQNVAAEMKSVTRQIENGKAFAAKKGWVVTHEFSDDAFSGAEFDRRPGFSAMMASLTPRAPFQILIVSEQKSIGREMSETAYTVKRLAEAGVEVFEYVHGKSLTPKNAMDKVMASMTGFADEDHRVKSSERVHEAHLRLAGKGYVTGGGRLYGYTKRDVFNGVDRDGRPLRSHVDLEIFPPEAKIVRRIFNLFSEGLGLKMIAKTLNGEGAPAPKPFLRKDCVVPPVAAWSAPTVRAVLGRETYRGVKVWNKSKRRNEWGKVDSKKRPESEWQRAVREDLRIISEALWARVQERRGAAEGRAIRFESGRLSGRPRKDDVRNLLVGLSTCGVCGGGLIVFTSGNNGKRRPRYSYYGCFRQGRSGQCSNAIHMPVDVLNEAVLSAIEEHALTPEAIERVIRLTERDDIREREGILEKEAKETRKKIERLVDVIANGGDAAPLVAKVRELEARERAIERERIALRPVPRLLPAVIENRLAEWRRLLRSSITQSRAVLQRILVGRLTFTPRADGGYDFSGPTRFDRLFTGVAVECPPWIPKGNEGLEHLGREDTGEADRERLLESAEKAQEPLAPPSRGRGKKGQKKGEIGVASLDVANSRTTSASSNLRGDVS